MESDVASLDRVDSASQISQDSPEQVRNAFAMGQCLRDAGLPATIERLDEDTASVQWDLTAVGLVQFASPQYNVMSTIPGELWTGPATVSNQLVEAFAARAQESDDTLEIDGVDHSSTYNECAKSTGYTIPGGEFDYSAELREKQRLIEVTNEWLACAREEEYPDLPDVGPAVADGYATAPIALLPLSMTENQLRALVASCPLFEKARAQCEAEASQQCGPNPAVGFTDGQGDESRQPGDDADARAKRLESVLWEEMAGLATSEK
jgi:hypothetical protein